nr:tetratricopeptide repeat protein [Iningainema tapete]
MQELLEQKKYRQALEEIKKIQRSQPNIEFSFKVADIWLLRGQQEFQKQDFKQAEKSFSRALEMGLVGEVHYWQTRCLLELHQLDAAVKLLRDAFEAGKLPENYSIYYLKLLFLKGDTATVEQLINQNSKQFNAAQLNWVQGILALKNGQPEAALTFFQKIKRPLTPGDVPSAWIAYSQQLNGNWDAAANILGLESQPSRSYSRAKYLEHPILEKLATFQLAKTGQPPLEMMERGEKAKHEALSVLLILQLIDDGDNHEAAHLLMKKDWRFTRFPELQTIRSSLLTLAGQQAFNQGQTSCAELFWQQIVTEQPFNTQLAVNLLEVLEANDSWQEFQRLLNRLIKWLENEGKQNPQEWQGERLKLTLAYLHCRVADSSMAMNRDRAAMASVQQAERICPTSPEVIGRKGLIAVSDGNFTEAIPLLTEALQGGCKYEEVYGVLLKCLERQGDKQALTEARRRFGKSFGDVGVDKEVEELPWMDALSTLSYPFYSRLVQTGDQKDPALNACRIFVNAVQSPPNSGGRVSLNQKKAAQEWETILKPLSAQEKIPVLQAIAISIHLFAKREKGIAALTNQYVRQLFELSGEQPEARIAHLVVLTVKENNAKKLEFPLRAYLDTMPQPGNALANIQLQVRRFGTNTNLVSALDEALRREPQNPLLLLARATTYPVEDSNYEQLKQQGFELARRLQDAKALQAYREEQAFLSAQKVTSAMPSPEDFDDLDMLDVDELLENMIRKLFGNNIPKAEFERILPELKQKMLNDMPDFMDDDDDDDDFELDLESIFGMPTPKKKKKGRTRGGFQELF